MRKILIGIIALLVMSFSALAGELYINDPGFEDGDNMYNGSAIVDADTVSGVDVLGYMSSRESVWTQDRVGGSGMSLKGLSRFLMGVNDFFEFYDTFIDYIDENYVPRTEYEAKINELEYRLDTMDSGKSGLSLDEYQKQRAIDSFARDGIFGEYGPYACYEGVCLKTIY